MLDRVTPISELQAAASGTLVELPSFGDGTRFIAKLKRPSLLGLLATGRIPNELLGVADQLFMGAVGGGKTIGKDNMIQMFEMLDLYCSECFVEPRYDELTAAGVTLTDEQIMFVFNYAQAGQRALSPFRGEQADPSADQHGTVVQLPSV